MQHDYYAAYREYLQVGTRLEMGIPLSGGGIFRDWAVVSESRQDELLVQISRDMLPSNVRVDVGFILDVSIWIKKEAYTCSGIVTEKTGGRLLRIRLFGNFTLRERRQFFRMDLNLRLKYAYANDENRREVERTWELRRDLEHMKFQGYDAFVIAAQKARHRHIELDWQDLPWAEVSLGGGGIRIRMPEPVHPEQLFNLEIVLPLSPPRQIQTVAQVVHTMAPKSQKGKGTYYNTGMQFLYLDERDRDLIFRHISVTQIALLREVADTREPDEPGYALNPGTTGWQEILMKVVWALVILVIIGYLVKYLIHYEKEGSNEIQKTYERSIREYRHEEVK